MQASTKKSLHCVLEKIHNFLIRIFVCQAVLTMILFGVNNFLLRKLFRDLQSKPSLFCGASSRAVVNANNKIFCWTSSMEENFIVTHNGRAEVCLFKEEYQNQYLILNQLNQKKVKTIVIVTKHPHKIAKNWPLPLVRNGSTPLSLSVRTQHNF